MTSTPLRSPMLHWQWMNTLPLRPESAVRRPQTELLLDRQLTRRSPWPLRSRLWRRLPQGSPGSPVHRDGGGGGLWVHYHCGQGHWLPPQSRDKTLRRLAAVQRRRFYQGHVYRSLLERSFLRAKRRAKHREQRSLALNRRLQRLEEFTPGTLDRRLRRRAFAARSEPFSYDGRAPALVAYREEDVDEEVPLRDRRRNRQRRLSGRWLRWKRIFRNRDSFWSLTRPVQSRLIFGHADGRNYYPPLRRRRPGRDAGESRVVVYGPRELSPVLPGQNPPRGLLRQLHGEIYQKLVAEALEKQPLVPVQPEPPRGRSGRQRRNPPPAPLLRRKPLAPRQRRKILRETAQFLGEAASSRRRLAAGRRDLERLLRGPEAERARLGLRLEEQTLVRQLRRQLRRRRSGASPLGRSLKRFLGRPENRRDSRRRALGRFLGRELRRRERGSQPRPGHFSRTQEASLLRQLRLRRFLGRERQLAPRRPRRGRAALGTLLKSLGSRRRLRQRRAAGPDRWQPSLRKRLAQKFKPGAPGRQRHRPAPLPRDPREREETASDHSTLGGYLTQLHWQLQHFWRWTARYQRRFATSRGERSLLRFRSRCRRTGGDESLEAPVRFWQGRDFPGSRERALVHFFGRQRRRQRRARFLWLRQQRLAAAEEKLRSVASPSGKISPFSPLAPSARPRHRRRRRLSPVNPMTPSKIHTTLRKKF